MNLILLSGGSGKRLWPLSNDIRSKQFLKLFKNEAGVYESMAQRIYRQIMTVSPDATVVVATGDSQVAAIRNQLGDKVDVCVEPMRRDTFPAIALAAAYMHSERGLDLDDVVIVCPVDPYVDTDYFEALKRLETAALTSDANLTLMGVLPTYPSEKYGYIIPEVGTEAIRRVSAFREKPDIVTAQRYMQQGALWNCGVFAFHLRYLLEILRGYMPFDGYQTVYDGYEQLPKISFDYAVVEKESCINCIEFIGQWKDVGTWNTLAEELVTPAIGNVCLDDTCSDVQVINELETPLLVMGASHMIIAACADGILVSSKEQSSFIKTYVNQIQQRVMYEEKSWGTCTILSMDASHLVAKLSVMAGKTMDHYPHDNHSEAWTVLSGEGQITLAGVMQTVRAGDVLQLTKGIMHSLHAITAMQLIELQIHAQVYA